MEARLVDEILQMKDEQRLFMDFDKFKMLGDQTKAVLSMIPMEIQALINRDGECDESLYNFFEPNEFLAGNSLCDYKIWKLSQVKQHVADLEK